MAYQQWIFDRSNCAAVLLSGGRDSFLSSALAVEKGYNIVPVIFDNGHMEGVERAKYAVYHLQQVYGSEQVCDLVIQKTGMALLLYMKNVWQMSASAIAEEYPDLRLYQAHCLACKSAMYAGILKFCLGLNISVLVDGMRRCQGFFVDNEEMRSRFTSLCHDYGVELLTPLYELESDLERKRMLCDRGLPTKTLEPQCFLGCPMPEPLDVLEVESLKAFYDEELKKMVVEDISQMIGR